MTRVLHLPTTVGGQAWGLAQGERAIGLEPHVLSLYDNYIHYPVDYALHLEAKGAAGKLLGHLGAFLRFRAGFDAFHFNYGSTLLHFLNRGILAWDLPFYDRSARKIFTFNGCDARQKDRTVEMARALAMPAACLRDDCYGGMCNDGRLDRNRRRAIEKIERHADHIFAVNPDLLSFLPQEKTSFLPYTVADFATIAPKTTPFCKNGKVRIVHAPTQRGAKGSDHVLAALATLAEEFPERLEVTVVEGMSHADAIATYRTADLFIDQVLVGWYGGVAVEVMKMGIPVACFINPYHRDQIHPSMASGMPLVDIGPFDMVERLRPLLKEPEQLAEIGARSKEWVERWHDPVAIAALTAAAYRGEPVPGLA